MKVIFFNVRYTLTASGVQTRALKITHKTAFSLRISAKI